MIDRFHCYDMVSCDTDYLGNKIARLEFSQLHILPVREFLVYGFCKRKYENGTENGRPLHKCEPEFAPVEAMVDFTDSNSQLTH